MITELWSSLSMPASQIFPQIVELKLKCYAHLSMISSGSSIKVCASRSRRRQTPLAVETYTALSSLRNFLTYLVSAATCSFHFPSNCSSNHRLWLEPSSSRCTDLSCLQVLSRKWSSWSSNNRNSLWVEGNDYLGGGVHR